MLVPPTLRCLVLWVIRNDGVALNDAYLLEPPFEFLAIFLDILTERFLEVWNLSLAFKLVRTIIDYGRHSIKYINFQTMGNSHWSIIVPWKLFHITSKETWMTRVPIHGDGNVVQARQCEKEIQIITWATFSEPWGFYCYVSGTSRLRNIVAAGSWKDGGANNLHCEERKSNHEPEQSVNIIMAACKQWHHENDRSKWVERPWKEDREALGKETEATRMVMADINLYRQRHGPILREDRLTQCYFYNTII